MHVLHVIMKEKTNIAWLKRDLRTSDNLVLDACEREHIPYMIIYIFDPKIIKADNTIAHKAIAALLSSKLKYQPKKQYEKKYNQSIKQT